MTLEQTGKTLLSGYGLSMLCLVVSFTSGFFVKAEFFQVSTVALGLCGLFAFIVLKKQYVTYSIVNLTCLLPILSNIYYFTVIDSELAEPGFVLGSLAGINTLLCLNFWMKRPKKDGFHVDTLGAFIIVGAVQGSISLALINGNLSLGQFRGVLAITLVGLGAHFAALLSKKFHRGIRRKDQFLTLSLPCFILSAVSLVYPVGLFMPVMFSMATVFVILAYNELKKQTDTIHTQAQSRIQYATGNSWSIEQFGFELRTCLDAVIQEAENLLETSAQNPMKALKSIVSQTECVMVHWQATCAAHYLLVNNRSEKLEFSPEELMDVIKRLHKDTSLNLQAVVPETFPKLHSSILSLAMVIYSLVNRSEFNQVRFKLHFYNTISNGKRFANIDIRGFSDSLAILDHPVPSQKSKNQLYAIQEEICKKLGGGFVDKSTRAAVPFFTIFIPIEDMKTPAQEKNSEIDEPQLGSSVLVVDDDPDIVDILSDYIHGHGIKVIQSQAGRDALEKFQAEKPFCVITDMLMPGMNGIELIRSIRQESLKSTIIGISGTRDKVWETKAKEEGANHFYTKPPHLDKILEKVQEATKTIEKKVTQPIYQNIQNG